MKTLEQIRSATVLVMADMQTPGSESGGPGTSLGREQPGLEIQPRRRRDADRAAPGLGALEPSGFVLGTEQPARHRRSLLLAIIRQIKQWQHHRLRPAGVGDDDRAAASGVAVDRQTVDPDIAHARV